MVRAGWPVATADSGPTISNFSNKVKTKQMGALLVATEYEDIFHYDFGQNMTELWAKKILCPNMSESA
jgi:hypothetical protein